MIRKVLLGAAACLALPACVPQSQYYWGNYSEALYGYYEDPTRRPEYQAALVNIVEAAGPQNRVPPGIYAEIGYLELQNGNKETARQYFERERTAWPESAVFMGRMIQAIDAPPETSKSPAASADAAPPNPTVKPGS